jgi:hypothetical protein
MCPSPYCLQKGLNLLGATNLNCQKLDFQTLTLVSMPRFNFPIGTSQTRDHVMFKKGSEYSERHVSVEEKCQRVTFFTGRDDP